MKARMRTMAIAVALMVGGTGTALGQWQGAQPGGVQLGIDTGLEIITFPDGGHRVTSIGVPGNSVSMLPGLRIGAPVADAAQVEIALGLASTAYERGNSQTEMRAGASLLGYMTKQVDQPRPFVRLGAVMRVLRWHHLHGTSESAGPQFGFGGGVGTEVPLGAQGAIRFEGSYTRFLEKEDEFAAMNVFAFRLGLSVRV